MKPTIFRFQRIGINNFNCTQFNFRNFIFCAHPPTNYAHNIFFSLIKIYAWYTRTCCAYFRFASLLTIEMHPTKSSLYYVGTADGIIHECSIYDSYQHKCFKQVHKYGVYSVEFSPFSPKIFLTCGFDWFVYIYLMSCYRIQSLTFLFFCQSFGRSILSKM